MPDDLAPNDLAELYARDPQQLTRTELDVLIAAIRKDRLEFRLGEKTPKKRTKKSEKQAVLDL